MAPLINYPHNSDYHIRFAPGMEVMIAGGQFTGRRGKITSRTKQRYRVTVLPLATSRRRNTPKTITLADVSLAPIPRSADNTREMPATPTPVRSQADPLPMHRPTVSSHEHFFATRSHHLAAEVIAEGIIQSEVDIRSNQFRVDLMTLIVDRVLELSIHDEDDT